MKVMDLMPAFFVTLLCAFLWLVSAGSPQMDGGIWGAFTLFGVISIICGLFQVERPLSGKRRGNS